jgi:hypothetical protein
MTRIGELNNERGSCAQRDHQIGFEQIQFSFQPRTTRGDFAVRSAFYKGVVCRAVPI